MTLLFALSLPAFDALSQWQWRRLHERQEHNAQIHQAETRTAVALSDLLTSPTSSDQDPTLHSDSQWRNVNVRGIWDTSWQVFVRKKSLESNLGFWVITPLKLDNGTYVLINRGWTAATASATASPSLTAPPSGQIALTGRIRLTPARMQAKPTDLPARQVDTIVPKEILTKHPVVSNGYIEMTASAPESLTPELRELPAPELTEGSHRSYAMQWIAFAIMAVIGWGVLVRNEYLHRKSATATPDETA